MQERPELEALEPAAEDRAPAEDEAPPSPIPPPRPAAGPRHEIAIWAVLAFVVAGIFVLTMLGSGLEEPGDEDTAGTAATAGSLEFRFQGRYAVGVDALFGELGESFAEGFQAQLLDQVTTLASSPDERLCLVPVVAELTGTEDAIDRIEALRQTPDLPEAAARDLEILERLYGGGELTDDERAGLLRRRGWFARLALTQAADSDEAERGALLAGSKKLAVVMIALVMAVVGAGVAGCVLLAVGFVLHRQGKLRLRYEARAAPGAPARRVPFLETVVVFVLATIGASVVVVLLLGEDASTTAMLGSVLLAVPAVLWPYLRGVEGSEVRYAYGWHRGTGVLKEVGWGLVGYVAGAPLLILAILTSLLLSTLVDQMPHHPLMDGLAEAGPAGILMIFLVACVSAPLVEETIFRGGFHHYLRSRLGVVASAFVVSLIFAGIHPQGIVGVPPLLALAMILAFIREWRGSLVGSVAVHAVHNGLATTVLFVVLG